MKKFRKGFTLVELLIVISVIGILGAMGMMGGSEANTIATATKITEDLKIISSAMNMYYADNKTACDIGKASLKDDAEDLKATDIRAGTVPYLKSGAYLTADSTPVDGKYTIIINVIDIDESTFGRMNVTELERNIDDVYHASTEHCDFSFVFDGIIQRLLNPMDIGAEGRYNYSPFGISELSIESGADGFFAGRVTFLFGVC